MMVGVLMTPPCQLVAHSCKDKLMTACCTHFPGSQSSGHFMSHYLAIIEGPVQTEPAAWPEMPKSAKQYCPDPSNQAVSMDRGREVQHQHKAHRDRQANGRYEELISPCTTNLHSACTHVVSGECIYHTSRRWSALNLCNAQIRVDAQCPRQIHVEQGQEGESKKEN
jgi:hypothetical protein